MTDIVLVPPRPVSMQHRLSVSSYASDASNSSSESPKQIPSYYLALQVTSPQSNDDIIPKIEEADEEEVNPEDISPVTPADPNAEFPVAKRRRGRPRKHPRPPDGAAAKTPKGRSKTGCKTCRRRKKKCDEAKPFCMHCQKNNVVCEGYIPKVRWQPGKHNSIEGRRFSIEGPSTLPLLFDGMTTDLDSFLFDHYKAHASRVLSLFDGERNPFTELLIPMAFSNEGLMHSLLSLAGAHLLSDPDSVPKGIKERSHYHLDKALVGLRTDLQARTDANDDRPIDDANVAQVLVMLLRHIVSGETDGQYRPHLLVAKHFLPSQRSKNEDFQNFVVECVVYHDVSNSITCLDWGCVLMTDDFQMPSSMSQPEAGAFLGVQDGLFPFIARIRQLRCRIRERKAQQVYPLVDLSISIEAQAIDSGLREWKSLQPADTPRWIASLLYHQCTWIFLYRTIQPSKPSPKLEEAVDRGLDFLRELPPDSSTQSILLMPLFHLGCAAFEKRQRPDIEQAFDDLLAYSKLGNIKYARIIVHKVWEMMDAGQEESWDWETIMRNHNWDFLVT